MWHGQRLSQLLRDCLSSCLDDVHLSYCAQVAVVVYDSAKARPWRLLIVSVRPSYRKAGLKEGNMELRENFEFRGGKRDLICKPINLRTKG